MGRLGKIFGVGLNFFRVQKVALRATCSKVFRVPINRDEESI